MSQMRSRNGSISASCYSRSSSASRSNSNSNSNSSSSSSNSRKNSNAKVTFDTTTTLASSPSPINKSFTNNSQSNPEFPSFNNRNEVPRSSSLNSAPASISNSTAAFAYSSPKSVLSFEITQSLVSVTCIKLESNLPTQFTQAVVFDDEFPEYKTRNGSYTSDSNDGMCSLTPIEMVIKGIDLLMERLKSNPNIDFKHVVAIGSTGASHFPVLLSGNASQTLTSLCAKLPLQSQLTFPTFFTLPFLPNEEDDSASAELRMLEANFEQSCLLAKENAAPNSSAFSHINSSNLSRESKERSSRLLGASLSSSSVPSQLSKIRNGLAIGFVGDEQVVDQSWERTKHVLTIGNLLHSIFVGKIGKVNESEATEMGFYNPREKRWEVEILDYVSAGQALKLEEMLGKVRRNGEERVEKIGKWMVDRFGFDSDCIVSNNLPLTSSTYLSFLPKPKDAILSFGKTSDHLLLSSSRYIPSSKYSILPNPIFTGIRKSNGIDQEDSSSTSPSPWIVDFKSIDSSKARKIARDSFCNGKWNVLSHMCAITPSGGSIGMDNKMFTISVPKGNNRGIRRFEHGVRVAEFSDTRVNSRCLVEGQALAMRAIMSKVAAQNGRQPPNKAYNGSGGRLGFNPFYENLAPSKIYTDGKASGNKSISKIYSDCLGADMIVSKRFVEEIERDEEIEPLEKLSGSTDMSDPRSRSDSVNSGGRSFEKNSVHERERFVNQVNEKLRGNEEVDQPSRALIGAAYFAIFNYDRQFSAFGEVYGSKFNDIIGSFFDGKFENRQRQSQVMNGGTYNRRTASDSVVSSSQAIGRENQKLTEEEDLKTPKAPLRDLEPEEDLDSRLVGSGLVAAAPPSALSQSNPSLRAKPSDFSSSLNSNGSSERPEGVRRQRSFTMGNEDFGAIGSKWPNSRLGNSRQTSNFGYGNGNGNLLLTTDNDIIQSYVESLESILNSHDVLQRNVEYLGEKESKEPYEAIRGRTRESKDLNKGEEKMSSNGKMKSEKEELEMFGLVKLAERDDDAYAIYGGLLEEHMRLMEFQALE